MKKFSLSNAITSVGLSGLLALPSFAGAGTISEESALDCAMQAIEATMGAGNISAERLNADPMGIVKTAGTSIASMRTKNGKTESAQAFVSDDGKQASFTTGIVEPSNVAYAQTHYRVNNDYSDPYTTAISLTPDTDKAVALNDKIATNFQHRIDNYNMANIEVMAREAMQRTLPHGALTWTDYDEVAPTTIHVRSCRASDNGTVCNELATTLKVAPETQAVGMKVAASLTLPAAKQGEPRKTMTVTTAMDDIRNPRTLDKPRTPKIMSEQDFFTSAALASETLMTIEGFLSAKRGVTSITVRVPVEMGGVKYYVDPTAILNDKNPLSLRLDDGDTSSPDLGKYNNMPGVRTKQLKLRTLKTESLDHN